MERGRVQERLKDAHEPDAKGDAGEDGDDKGDGGACRPAEPEEGEGKERTAEAGEREPAVLLASGPRGAAGLGAAQVVVPGEEDGEREKASDADGQVGQTALARGEAVEVLEDEGVCFKGHVEDGVAER